MILEDTLVRDLTMTLVIATIGKDGIVISADGRSLPEDKPEIELNFDKIREIKDKVFAGFSGRLASGDINRLFNEASKNIDFTHPYLLEKIAKQFVLLAKDILSANYQNQSVNFIIVGYDKNKRGRSTDPHIYKIDDDYILSYPYGLQEISIGVKRFKPIPIPTNTEKLVEYTREAINTVSKNITLVGPPYKTIIIKKDKIEKRYE